MNVIEKLKIKVSLFITLGLFILVPVFIWVYQVEPVDVSNKASLKPVPSISYQFHNHIHGMGYDSQNQRLFIATHYGIFIWQEGKLFQLGDSRDDFMGFSLHPSNPNTIYTSGHPGGGGNMGVMKSEDGGVAFKQMFRGLHGETVDFHTMAISPANPNLLYGWYEGKLYRSKDGGKAWTFAAIRGLPSRGFCWGTPCLSPDGKKASLIYAGASNGLFVSDDFAESWKKMDAQLGALAGLGVDPVNSQRLFAFTENFGLAMSQDGGKNWKPRNNGVELSPKEFVFAFAYDRKHPSHLFAATGEQVFRTTSGGEKWEKIL